MLRKAKSTLECAAECDQACQHCVLSYDTRFRIDELDRFSALEFMSESWLDSMALQEEEALFGIKQSSMEHQSLGQAITRIWNKPESDELRLYLTGEVSEWDLSISPLRKYIQKWSSDGRDVRIVMSNEALPELDKSNRYILNLFSGLDGVSVHTGEPPMVSPGGYVVAECVIGDGSIAWASRDVCLGMPDSNWGASDSGYLVRGRLDKKGDLGDVVSIDDSAPDVLPETTCTVEIKSEVDGRANGFGIRLLQAILDQSATTILSPDDEVVGVKYFDRYLVSPLPSILLVRFISSLKKYYGPN